MSPLQRAELMSKIAAELVGYAEDIIPIDDKRAKIEFMAECFSEIILGMFKMYYIMNPDTDLRQLIDDFAAELEDKLDPFLDAKPTQMIN